MAINLKNNAITPQAIKNTAKALAPDDLVPYEGALVAAVDKLLEISKQRGYPKTVSGEKDWDLVEQIIKLWAALYPEQSDDFFTHQRWSKNNQKNEFASNREGEAQVRHLLEIPQKLWDMIHAVFPEQKAQDKEFARKFARKLPGFSPATKV